jgi:tripartite-type tricarboxylate transporter receptor subunit TctC
MFNRRHTLALGSCIAGVALMTRGGVAQSKYPERPIRLVIPYASGGASDAIGRPWADKMKALLGTVVIENQAGAGGMLGTAAVAHAQADGYTILLGTAGPQVVSPTAAGHPPYDPVRDFTPIAILAVSALGIMVHPSVPARTLNDLVAYARANPGKLSYGSAGVGTINHLTGELFKSLTGIADIVHVPYGKGGGQLVSDLLGGQVPIIVLNVNGQAIELHHSGKLRMLAVTAPARLSAAPDIPTAVEQGFELIARNFYGLFVPAGTPAAIVERISEATRAAMADEELRESLIGSGLEPYPDSSPEAARRFVEDEVNRWRPVIIRIGLKLGM